MKPISYENLGDVYALLFGKSIFKKWNQALYYLGLRGLGVLNYKTKSLTGEYFWLKNYLSNTPKPVIIDVGANIGDYSKDILSINHNSKILAFEPHPKTFQFLKNNLNQTTAIVLNYAVGSKKGRLKLYDYANQNGSSHASLYKEVISDLWKEQVISHEVNVVNLDDILSQQSIENIDLLKIDTEGNELDILLGCKKYLDNNKIRAIHFEFNEMNIISKTSFKDFWDLLNNYDFYRILPKGNLLSIKEYSPITCEIYIYQNIVAINKNYK